ncbi:MAG: hypothetical protein CBB98_09770 [Rhodobacteraceae bacterium TMED38]|nr:MAG: hypothetical protein CBB98_09770 [Rhodobacteraceae bacterium TMED38]
MLQAHESATRRVIIYNIYKHINDLHLSDGETKRMKCPNCGERTFTVTNNMGTILWNCYKLSCNVSGQKRVRLSVDDIKARKKGVQKMKEEFELPSYIIPHRNKRTILKFCYTYNFEPDEVSMMYDVKEDRAVFPISDGKNFVDAVGRSLSGRLPKWKRYGNSDLPFYHGCGNVAVVVEDCVSAAVVGGIKSFVGVALLGTSLQEGHKGYLTQFSTAVIALDPDALTKNLQIAKELRGHVNDVRVLRLTDDLKYRNPEDMEKLNGIIAS